MKKSLVAGVSQSHDRSAKREVRGVKHCARGAWRVARLAVVAVMALVFGLACFVASAEAAGDIDPNGTYIETENYNTFNTIGAPNLTVVADGAANSGSTVETTNGNTNNTPAGDRLDYDVNFTTGGTYYFWLRLQNSGTGDSAFFGIDGTMVGALTQTTDGAYYWTNNTQTGNNSVAITAGPHTINIWGRENVFNDGFYLTTALTVPPGLGGGPGAYTGTIPTGATVLDPTAVCTPANPSVNISTAPIEITTDGGTADYSFTVTNNDTAACAARAFALSVADSAVTNFDASTLSVGTTGSLAPGATSSTFTMTANATAGQSTGSVTSTITAAQGGDSGTDAVTTTLNVPCTDTDLATLTTGTSPASPVSGTTTVYATVGTETAPATMGSMQVTIAGTSGGTCDVTGAAMAWSAGNSRWEYSWDTSACGTGGAETGITIDVSGTDPDCSTLVNATQISVNIDNTCTPSITALDISASPNPINTPSPGTSTITVTPTGDTVTNAQWSVDGSSWFASGTDYTAPAQSVGSVNALGRATEDTCGTVFNATNQPYTLNYDTRTDTLTTQAPSAVQSGIGAATVTAPFLGDKNGDSTTRIRRGTSPGGPYVAIGCEAVTGGSPRSCVDNSGLADGTYYYEVLFTDGDGVNGTNPQEASVTLVAWVDNYLLHNSNRFACSETGFFQNEAECVGAGGTWTYDRKWTVTGNEGEWGTNGANDQYGPIMCSTCHAKDTGNIKRIVTGVTAATNSFPGQGETISFQDAIEPNTDFGDDTGGHATSTKICEVCHSQTDYHRYDTTGQAGGLLHYNNQDCISCHEHEGGFRASCAACHGNPPVDAGTLVSTKPTDSATAGAHDAHVNTLGYACERCHNGSVGGGVTHDTDGTVTISFADLPVGNPAGADGGSYSGQDVNGGAAPPPVDYDTTDGGATTVPGTNDGNMTCANYCHGSTINAPTDPTWTGAVNCGDCHAAAAGNVGNATTGLPSDVSHATHAGTGGTGIYQSGDITLDCNNCHGAGYSAGTSAATGHVDGDVLYNVTALASDYRAPGTPNRYDGNEAGSSGALAPSGTYQTCSNLACHWGTTTPTWNNGPATCTSCHNNGTDDGDLNNAAPNGGSHAEHAGANPLYVDCDSCHGSGATTGTHTGHIDNNATYGSVLAGNISGDGGRGPDAESCADNCHESAVWGGDINWTGGVVDACTDCHSDAFAGKSGPIVVTTPLATPSGSHLRQTVGQALPTTAANWKTRCLACHPKHFSAGAITIDLPTTNYDNPATAGADNINMRTQLGINYVGANHGGIYLQSALGANEADACWTCHDSEGVSEWGYNTDTNSGTFPTTVIADRDGGSQGSHNFGWTYTTQTARDNNTVASRTSRWVDNSGDGYWHRDAYSADGNLQRRITSVHTGNVNVAGVSSVEAVNTTTGVLTAATQESPSQIRCTYCHDVHELGLAAGDAVTGKPYLRGSWMGNPYPPDIPPEGTYPLSYMFDNNGNFAGKPRLFSDSTQKGGYFLDANSGRPTTNASYDTLAETAGICTLCHGTDVDNMDFYPNSDGPQHKLWRSDQVNGHANSTLGGGGAGATNARDLFDARRGTASYPGIMAVYMGSQDGLWLRNSPAGINHNYGVDTFEPNAGWTGGTSYGDPPGASNGVEPKSGAPHRDYNPSEPANSGRSGYGGIPASNSGWYGGTVKSQASVPSQFYTWYSAGGIGHDGSGSGQAHSFSCSKCHSPHASGLPALLTTNCIDPDAASWGNNSYGPNATGTWGQRVANNCHRNESTSTGWHRMAPAQ